MAITEYPTDSEVEIRNRRVYIDDLLVPKMTASKNFNGGWTIAIDNRFVVTIDSADDVHKVVWILAQSMAVAAGFTNFGKGSKFLNPFTGEEPTGERPVV